MKIQDQTVVTMTYVLRENDENGPILQETTKENPFVCIFGMHQLLPKFEENLMGKEPGDHYAFLMQGFGENLKENVHTEKREYYADQILENVAYLNGLVAEHGWKMRLYYNKKTKIFTVKIRPHR